MKTYEAPWSKSLVVISTLATLLCCGVAVSVIWSTGGMLQWTALAPIAINGIAALFIIRRYSLTADAILVHRPFWKTRVPLAGLQSARSEPDAMRRSLRTFGKGGLFSCTGFFRNKALGAYRAFVTDPHRTMVLKFPGRTVVLSPSVPEAFVEDVDAARRVV